MGAKKVKSSNDKSVKSHKLSVTKFNGVSTKKKKVKTDTNRVNNQKTRNKDEFAQQLNELRERSLGRERAATAGRKKALPTLTVRAATFQVPSSNNVEPVSHLADQLLEGEKSGRVEEPKAKVVKMASYNRFELLENDEILEDGMHSILKMDVKPATFTLQPRDRSY